MRVGFMAVSTCRSIRGSSLMRISSSPMSTLLVLVSLLSLVSVLVLVSEMGAISLMRMLSRSRSRPPETAIVELIVYVSGIFGALITYLPSGQWSPRALLEITHRGVFLATDSTSSAIPQWVMRPNS